MIKQKITFWLLFGLGLYLFFAPISAAEHTGIGGDKIFHFFFFALLGFFAHRTFPKRKILPFILLFLYGFSVEVIQGELLPHRSFDLLDLVADGLGLLFIAYLLRKHHHAKSWLQS